MPKMSVVAIQNGPHLISPKEVGLVVGHSWRVAHSLGEKERKRRSSDAQVGVVGDGLHELVGEGDETADDAHTHLGGIHVKVLGVVLDVPDLVRLIFHLGV